MVRILRRSAIPFVAVLLSFPSAARAQDGAGLPPVPPPPPAPPPAPIIEPPPPPPVRERPHDALPPLPSDGFGKFGDLGSGLFGPPVFRADYRLTWLPAEPVSGQNTKLENWRGDFTAGIPLWQDGPDLVSGSVRVRGEFFSTEAILPTTGQPFPDQLWNINLGANYRHLFDNGWAGGVGVSVGSASDKPFHSIDEMTAGVNAFLRIPSGEHNAWMFFLAYSPTSEIAFPVPGVAYYWQPSDRFHMNIGLPFQLWYRPTDELTLAFPTCSCAPSTPGRRTGSCPTCSSTAASTGPTRASSWPTGPTPTTASSPTRSG